MTSAPLFGGGFLFKVPSSDGPPSAKGLAFSRGFISSLSWRDGVTATPFCSPIRHIKHGSYIMAGDERKSATPSAPSAFTSAFASAFFLRPGPATNRGEAGLFVATPRLVSGSPRCLSGGIFSSQRHLPGGGVGRGEFDCSPLAGGYHHTLGQSFGQLPGRPDHGIYLLLFPPLSPLLHPTQRKLGGYYQQGDTKPRRCPFFLCRDWLALGHDLERLGEHQVAL